MLFGFRGIRLFQVIMAFAATVSGIGAVVTLKAISDGGGWWMLPVALILGGVFLWLFTVTLRIPTSFVAISPERTRIRFAGFLDTVVDNNDILGARLVKHSWLGGLGVRTNFSGTVTLATASGLVAELVLRGPVRVWIIPRVWRIRADHLRLSVRHPEKMAERFGEPRAAPAAPATVGRPRKAKRGR